MNPSVNVLSAARNLTVVVKIKGEKRYAILCAIGKIFIWIGLKIMLIKRIEIDFEEDVLNEMHI